MPLQANQQDMKSQKISSKQERSFHIYMNITTFLLSHLQQLAPHLLPGHLCYLGYHSAHTSSQPFLAASPLQPILPPDQLSVLEWHTHKLMYQKERKLGVDSYSKTRFTPVKFKENKLYSTAVSLASRNHSAVVKTTDFRPANPDTSPGIIMS